MLLALRHRLLEALRLLVRLTIQMEEVDVWHCMQAADGAGGLPLPQPINRMATSLNLRD